MTRAVVRNERRRWTGSRSNSFDTGGGGGGGKELATLPLYTESPAVEQPAAVGKRFETTF
jgi:hypothetical protein